MSMCHVGQIPGLSEREIRNEERSRRLAAQGMVLLENNGILPLQLAGRRVALFGNGARHTVRGGGGSGEVNVRRSITAEQGLERAGALITTKAWLDQYDSIVLEEKKARAAELKRQYADTPELAFWAMLAWHEPLCFPTDRAYLADSDGDTAIYVLARTSQEGSDRKNEPGDYQLHPNEIALLNLLCSHYSHLIVVLNVGGVIDTSFLRDRDGIDAILLMGQAGSACGDALADVLSGRISPEGKLAATWAQAYEDYPNAPHFGRTDGNIDDEYYTEGIYVGYRWFDSFGKTPAYPFGYGMSYTGFRVESLALTAEGEQIAVTARVTNIGERYSGREVVQVYVSAPEGNVEKPCQSLVAYGKTRVLKPGECETVTLRFPVSRMLSYDERSAAWVLEKGDYVIRTGTHSRATEVTGILRLDRDVLWEIASHVLPLDCAMETMHADRTRFCSCACGTKADGTEKVILLDGAALERSAQERAEKQQREAAEAARQTGTPRTASLETRYLTMEDVRRGYCQAKKLAEQLTEEELAALCVGTARGGDAEHSVIGAASASCPGAAGETTSALWESRQVRRMILADGPAGLRLAPEFTVDGAGRLLSQKPALGGSFVGLLSDAQEPQLPADAVTCSQYCTAIPTATLLAQTWDPDALREAGDLIGEEMEEFGITLWLAPGMNIQRNPLCGRNFEYYSEDPLVSGICASAMTAGVQAHQGTGVAIKHFACNNLEDNRAYNNSHVGEQALREIYLKGFEIAVKASRPMAVMSSYNMINGVHAANSRDLLTTVLRSEWGFEGIVMTDWGTTAEPQPDLEGRMPLYGCSSAAGCIYAGNDLIMPGSRRDVDEILRAVNAEPGTDMPYRITRGELLTCAARILQTVAGSSAYETGAACGERGSMRHDEQG